MIVLSRRKFAAALAVAGLSMGLLAAPAARALEVSAAQTLVENVSSELIALWSSSKTDQEKRDAFEQIMNRTAAMDDIARVAIGRPWNDMSPAQQAAYRAVFPKYLARAYMDRLKGYNNETVEVTSAEDGGKKGVFVKTLVRKPTAGDPPIEVEWRVMDRNGPAQIFDIAVEGVSLVVTQRSEFTAMLDGVGGNFDQFIAKLQENS